MTDEEQIKKKIALGKKMLSEFVNKVDECVSTIGMHAEVANYLPIQIIFNDLETGSRTGSMQYDDKVELKGLPLESYFNECYIRRLDGRIVKLNTSNKGRYTISGEEGDSITREITVIFDGPNVIGIEIRKDDLRKDYDDPLERLLILEKVGLSKISFKRCENGMERSVTYESRRDDLPAYASANDGTIFYQDGQRHVGGISIEILDPENSYIRSTDKRYEAVIPVSTGRAADFVKQLFSHNRSQELFASMTDSIDREYPGAMGFINDHLHSVFQLCSLDDPLDDEFLDLYERFTSPLIDTQLPINTPDPYIIDGSGQPGRR